MLTLQLKYPDGHSEIVHVKEAIRMDLCAYCDEPMQVEVPQVKYYCKDSHRVRASEHRRIIRESAQQKTPV